MPYIEKIECSKIENQGQKKAYCMKERQMMLERMPFFQFEYMMQKHYVVRLDFLESLLRRGQTGFGIVEIEVGGEADV